MYIMPDYSKAVIYKIETGGQLYVGSTCNFAQRKYYHNRGVNFKCRGCNAKLYNTIRKNGEWKMTPIKEFPCENKTQLVIEEEKWRKELGATLNTNWCYITDAEILQKKREYIEKNKEYICEYRRQRYEKNKEHFREQTKQHRQENKEKIREKEKQYRQENKEKIRERMNKYRENNKDKIREQKAQYNEQNKENIRKQKGQKCECPICGSVVGRTSMPRHQRSKKCKAIALQEAQA